MAVSLSSLRQGKSHKPPRLVFYGRAKIGKTKTASDFPQSIILQIEEGAEEIGATRTPKINSFEEMKEWLIALATDDHTHKTLVVDSVDWLEPMVWEHVIKTHPTNEKGKRVASIEDYGYGKGYALAMNYWKEFFDAINYLRDEKGMTIIIIAHDQVKRTSPPDGEPYDRYSLKVNDKISDLIKEHSDGIFFFTSRVGIKQDDVGFGQKKNRAVGSDERIIKAQERPAFIAGTRFDTMPDELPMDCYAIMQHIPYYQQQTTGE